MRWASPSSDIYLSSYSILPLVYDSCLLKKRNQASSSNARNSDVSERVAVKEATMREAPVRPKKAAKVLTAEVSRSLWLLSIFGISASVFIFVLLYLRNWRDVERNNNGSRKKWRYGIIVTLCNTCIILTQTTFFLSTRRIRLWRRERLRRNIRPLLSKRLKVRR